MRIDPKYLDVWCIELTEVPLTQQALLTLSDSERSQATKFRLERDRARYLRSHIALRQILSSRLNCKADQLRFVRGDRGKPSVQLPDGEMPISFSLSHSADLALVGIAQEREIGVDVERLSTQFEWPPVAELFFTRSEIKSLDALLENQRVEQFFFLWVCKEAFLKATGDGLASATVNTSSVNKRRISFKGSNWSMQCFAPAPGYVGASCMQGEGCELKIHRWTSERENCAVQ